MTGYPVIHQLRSVTVKAKDCVTVDGLTTACMVLVEIKGKEMIKKLAEVEAFFIYRDQGKLSYCQSEGFSAERVE